MRLFFVFALFQISIHLAFSQVAIVNNLNNAGPGSLRATVNSATVGDTIVFNSNLLNAGINDTTNLLSEILITKRLYFKGLDNDTAKIYISGSDSTRIFRINITNPYNRKLTFLDYFFYKRQSRYQFWRWRCNVDRTAGYFANY
jgi:hypothetical protein